jgi:hypothetical protein
MMVSPEIAEAVRDLASRHTDALNRWDSAAIEDVFDERAVRTVTGLIKAEGREEILLALDKARSSLDSVFQILHGSTVVQAEDRKAFARVYASDYSPRRGKPRHFLALYNDRCIETANGPYGSTPR